MIDIGQDLASSFFFGGRPVETTGPGGNLRASQPWPLAGKSPFFSIGDTS